MIAIAVAKLGSQHAIIRFYPFDGDPRGMVRFGTNLVFLPMLLSVLLWAIVSIAMFGYAWWRNADYSAGVVVRGDPHAGAGHHQHAADGGARQRTIRHPHGDARDRALGGTGGWCWARSSCCNSSALAVYGGKIVAALLLLFYFAHWARRHIPFSREASTFAPCGKGCTIGLPLMANEMVAIVLVAIDRIMLKQMTGDFAAVGIYTIGYSLATQINRLHERLAVGGIRSGRQPGLRQRRGKPRFGRSRTACCCP
jgi:hypothetical protein